MRSHHRIRLSYTTLFYARPLPVRKQWMDKNRFLVVHLNERPFFFSRLPGFHEASLEEIAFKLDHLFSHYTFNEENLDITQRFFNTLAPDPFLDSFSQELLFCAEVLLFFLFEQNIRAKERPSTSGPLHLNTLYDPDLDEGAYHQTACLKIKIAPTQTNFEHTSKLIHRLSLVNPHITYRLDGNRRFELQELIDYTRVLENERIDYIEEPFKNFYDSFLFAKRSRLPLAIDESFTHYSLGHFPLKNWPVVMKPSLFGLSPLLAWLRKHPLQRAIISQTFEHESLMPALVFLAEERPLEHHGLENFSAHLGPL